MPCNRGPLVVHGNDGGTGGLGQDVLQRLEQGDVQDGFQIVVSAAHKRSPPRFHEKRAGLGDAQLRSFHGPFLPSIGSFGGRCQDGNQSFVGSHRMPGLFLWKMRIVFSDHDDL